jgi:hypothetical protein
VSDEDLIKRLKQRLSYCMEIEDISKRLTEMIGAGVGSASLPQPSTVTLRAICWHPWLVLTSGDAGNVHAAALEMNEERDVVGH